jgi:hypothetical protein
LTKRRGDVLGVFMFFPLWTLPELQSARQILGWRLAGEITQDYVTLRYHEFGGVPRQVFEKEKFRAGIIELQLDAIAKLTWEQTRPIVHGEIRTVDAMDASQPASAIMGYQLKANDHNKFTKKEAVLISVLIKEEIYARFIKELWQMMIDLGVGGWQIFEAYTRRLMTTEHSLESRVYVDGENVTGPNVIVGNCKKIKQVVDIVGAAIDTPNVVFHPVNKNFPLYDFIYQSEGHFHAFQVTMATSHSADPTEILKLEKKVRVVGGNLGENLTLYFLVPGRNFAIFRTRAPNPNNIAGGVHCKIVHASVPNPNAEQGD